MQPGSPLEGTLGIAISEIARLVTSLSTPDFTLLSLTNSLNSTEASLVSVEIMYGELQTLKNRCLSIATDLDEENNRRQGQYHIHSPQDITEGVINLSQWPS